jgi:DNA topoisomerase VI subunit B
MSKAKRGGAAKGVGGEVQVTKSPAEFFAEHQAIAGFDNLGKSLYTSIRELMENSLDACESIGVLPNISVTIEELTQDEFNQRRGISSSQTAISNAKDVDLFQKSSTKRKSAGSTAVINNKDGPKGGDNEDGEDDNKDGEDNGAVGATSKKARKKASQQAYFAIKVRDNGCGMGHNDVPELLGRVLSGSKYGVRQTRGKFGLGAKMALIWSKKSTGVPIKVTTAHRPKPNSPLPSKYTFCELDIDITNNCPRILQHTRNSNEFKRWEGTELELLIAGNWTTYKARIVQYLQQLAIITPYAQLDLTYDNLSEPQRNFSIRYDRRSEQMPPPSKPIKHHPGSVNNLVIQQLLEQTRCLTWREFLTKELSGVIPSVSQRIVAECGWEKKDVLDHTSSDRHIAKLVQVLRSVQVFKAPDGSCLSPLGEYNLNLGIRKVLEPEYVATARDKPGAYEGHPFIIEAGVSLGGKETKEGITVFRFANRIPLLFEGGADVSTRVALNKIKWSQYKIDHKRDKIGVFVSIVSTKIPYKGTSKEYIGDDIVELSASVKRALQSCCQQLRVHLMKRNAIRDQAERKSRLTKYIPDVSRSLFALLDGMNKRKEEQMQQEEGGPTQLSSLRSSSSKKLKVDLTRFQTVTDGLKNGTLTEEMIKKQLELAVLEQHATEEQLEADQAGKNADNPIFSSKVARKDRVVPLYLIPLFHLDDYQDDESKDDGSKTAIHSTVGRHDIQHPLFTFRPIHPIT